MIVTILVPLVAAIIGAVGAILAAWLPKRRPPRGAELEPELQARIRNQFEKLGLGRRHSVLCDNELAGRSYRLPHQFGWAEPREVSVHLSESARLAFAMNQNDRRVVMYEALAADEWYCAGDYTPPLAVAAPDRSRDEF